MKNTLKLGITFLIVILMVIPSASAWNWKTHCAIADGLYDNTPEPIKKNLNKFDMYAGAVKPDKSDLVDNKANHNYPRSVGKAKEYLEKAKAAYRGGNYNKESFYYGMASHYISDTFAAPHCGWIKDKSRYYETGGNLMPVYDNHLYYTGDIDELLKFGKSQGVDSIKVWNNTKDDLKAKNIVQTDLNRAYTSTYLIYKDYMGF